MSDDVRQVELTDEQVDNWRRVMIGVIGPYAALMPREDIEQMATMLQSDMDALADDFDNLGVGEHGDE